jgi:hypothetical protein
MSVLPPYASQTNQTFNSPLPVGIANSLTWTASEGVYIASISNVSPQIAFNASTTAIHATIQTTLANTTDGLNSWLVSAVPINISGGTILFQVAADPTSPTDFPISWAVNKY